MEDVEEPVRSQRPTPHRVGRVDADGKPGLPFDHRNVPEVDEVSMRAYIDEHYART